MQRLLQTKWKNNIFSGLRPSYYDDSNAICGVYEHLSVLYIHKGGQVQQA
jgi:hypothetical protein